MALSLAMAFVFLKIPSVKSDRVEGSQSHPGGLGLSASWPHVQHTANSSAEEKSLMRSTRHWSISHQCARLLNHTCYWKAFHVSSSKLSRRDSPLLCRLGMLYLCCWINGSHWEFSSKGHSKNPHSTHISVSATSQRCKALNTPLGHERGDRQRKKPGPCSYIFFFL